MMDGSKHDSFFRTKEKVRVGGERWVRYDGYDGRFSVCITQYTSGYRAIQIFVYRELGDLDLGAMVPNMYVEYNDTEPENVRLEMPYALRRFLVTDTEMLECAHEALKLAMDAAREIKERFIDRKEDLEDA